MAAMSGAHPPEEREGWVTAAYAQRCLVWSGEREWECVVGARLLREGPVVVGDRVRFHPAADGTGALTVVLPRRTVLERPAARRERAGREGRRSAGPQVLAANVEQLVVVASLREPPFRPGLVERMLVAGAKAGLALRIQITKRDLAPEEELAAWMAHFAALGIPALGSALSRPETLEPLRQALAGQINILAGHSGVGKTSLLNALAGTDLEVAEVSSFRRRGRHTTSTARLIPLPGGGWVIDSPGVREFGLHGVGPADLARHFPGMAPHLGRCAFRDCLHRGERGCGVREAVERGTYAQERYGGYLKLLAEVEGE